MIDFITLGPTPMEENCQQIGPPTFDGSKESKELIAYKHQLMRMFKDIPSNCKFIIRSFPHDFGRYREVCITYYINVPESEDFAFEVESNLPLNWDEEALKELNQ